MKCPARIHGILQLPCGEQEVHGVAKLIDRTIEVFPLACHLDVSLIVSDQLTASLAVAARK